MQLYQCTVLCRACSAMLPLRICRALTLLLLSLPPRQHPPQVCSSPECRDKLKHACTKRLPCGHPCGGLRGERPCIPCVREDCLLTQQHRQLPKPDASVPGASAASAAALDAASRGACCVCLDSLECGPCLLLACGARHAVHAACALARLKAGPPGPELSFNFLFCPACGPQGGEARPLQVGGGTRVDLGFGRI